MDSYGILQEHVTLDTTRVTRLRIVARNPGLIYWLWRLSEASQNGPASNMSLTGTIATPTDFLPLYKKH